MSSSESDSRQGSSRDGTIHGRRKGSEPHGDWLENPQKRQKLVDGIYRFGISKSKGKKFFKWMGKGLEDSESKEIKARYSPTFEKKSAKLQCPSLDDCLYQRLMLIKGSSASKSSIYSNKRPLYKLQQKVLEVTKPLLFLANERVEKESHHEAIRDALQLLGDSFHEITQQRRHNILRQTSPSFVYLLNNPDNFNPDQFSELFSASFIRSMVRSADTQAKFGHLSREGQPNRYGGKTNSRESRFFGRRGHDHSGKSFVYDRWQGGTDSHHLAYRTNQRAGFNGQQDRDERSSQQHSFKFPLIGDRLRFFVAELSTVSGDPWVLSTVSVGLKLEFTSAPFQVASPLNMRMNAAQIAICEKEVLNLDSKGTVIEAQVQGFVSGIFVIPKKAGGFRPVINLKELNCFIVHHHFKMKGLVHMRHLVRPIIWMAKLDLQDAYLTVPVHATDQHYLQFIWGGKIFQFTCLAFGLSSAPWAFTKLLKPVVSFLREQDIKIIVYLDDFLILNVSRSKLAQQVDTVKNLLRSLGFVINPEKSRPIPTQRAAIIALCKQLKSGTGASLRDLATLLGNFAWAAVSVPFAPAHVRGIQHLYITGFKSARGVMQSKVLIDKNAREDIELWIENLMSCTGKSVARQVPTLVIFSDASLSGWGAV
ncbi:Uncharacterized protein APZ42_023097 [Daphnia magna]|uniref:Reverse transcriptase domain-containing protein n=1 Tax=Daphnia magna TaxID=35525 RepID=A0A164V6F2_9CRUS|nr:Uncharacterized protein APZ42_023097 [Daphnia magna]